MRENNLRQYFFPLFEAGFHKYNFSNLLNITLRHEE